ncbi:MAG: 30S ribosomal protein S20 [Rhodospirillales bacterium]|nr:30S ribosomal protein S20 [Rhodospirillales bacterium]
MAHHASAKKRIRQIERRTEINGMRMSRIRTFLRKVEDAIASGDQDSARVAFRAAQPELMRGAKRGLIHRNTVARRLSRMSARIKAMGG